MFIVMMSFTIDPAQSENANAAYGEFMRRTERERQGAHVYEFLADFESPAKRRLYQVWPDRVSFEHWVQSDLHEALAVELLVPTFLSQEISIFDAERITWPE